MLFCLRKVHAPHNDGVYFIFSCVYHGKLVVLHKMVSLLHES